MATVTSELRELGQFFRTRRGELRPERAGLIAHGDTRRRVRGLRREEVAELASISTDYYTRIEQGRLAPSGPVLAALARAMQLDAEQTDYVRALLVQSGRITRSAPRKPAQRTARTVRPQLARLLAQLDHMPALVFGPYLDILAWNDLAAALLTDFAQVPERQRNYVRLVFTDPAVRALYPEWEQVARTSVAVLRMNAADNPGNPALSTLVGDLSIASPEFRQWWAERRVAHQNFGTKLIRHPIAGDLTLDWNSFTQAGTPDQQLVLWSAEPGTPSERNLRLLAQVANGHVTPTTARPAGNTRTRD